MRKYMQDKLLLEFLKIGFFLLFNVYIALSQASIKNLATNGNITLPITII